MTDNCDAVVNRTCLRLVASIAVSHGRITQLINVCHAIDFAGTSGQIGYDSTLEHLLEDIDESFTKFSNTITVIYESVSSFKNNSSDLFISTTIDGLLSKLKTLCKELIHKIALFALECEKYDTKDNTLLAELSNQARIEEIYLNSLSIPNRPENNNADE